MRKSSRSSPQLQWLTNALSIRQGHRLTVLPIGDRGLELRLQPPTEKDSFTLVAIADDGEPTPLATFVSERQAQRQLRRLHHPDTTLGAWLLKAGVIAVGGFAAWFLFILPIDAEFTRNNTARWLQESPASRQHPAPVRLDDPAVQAQAARAVAAASTPLTPVPAPTPPDREQQLRNAFGLSQ